MNPASATRRTTTARIFSAMVVGALAFSSMSVAGVAAPPSSPDSSTTASDASPRLSASLESSAPAIPTDGTLDYTAVIRCSGRPSYLQGRLSLHRPGGRLVYRKTLVAPPTTSTEARLDFTRELADLDLSPGVHPVELEVRAEIGGQLATRTLSTALLVYGRTVRQIPVAVAVRVEAASFTDPSGATIVDPAAEQQSRADAQALADLVLADPDARLSLAIPPLVLMEWRRVAGGYTLSTANGKVTVPAEDATPRAYAETLDRLAAAVDTGRLELLSQGYSDPDLGRLAASGLGDDVSEQYAAGASVTRAALVATGSAGTAPPGGLLGAGGDRRLMTAGLRFAVASPGAVRSGTSTPTSGPYPLTSSGLVALVTDGPSSAALARGDVAPLVRRTFERSLSKRATPFIVAVEMGDEDASATDVVPALRTVFAQPWVRPATAAESASATATAGAKRLRVTPSVMPRGADADYWRVVATARSRARALLAAAGEGDPEATRAQTNSLAAEASALSDSDATDELTTRGRALAEDAEKTADAVLDAIAIKGSAVTLAGAKGNVPVTVTNGTDKTLKVTLRATPDAAIRVKGRKLVGLSLRPQENYTQIPVDLGSALSGKLRVEVVSAGVVLGTTDIEVKASYLDRLALIGGIVVLLGVLLIFIVRRVRGAEAGGDAAADPARYTGASTDGDGESDRE